MAWPMQEAFYCIYLDRKNHPLGRHLITLGTLDSTLVSPREVFRGAILASASALIVAHNHPSGDPSPSSADLNVTRKLREAAKLLEIPLLDHVVVGDLNADPQGPGYIRLGRPAFCETVAGISPPLLSSVNSLVNATFSNATGVHSPGTSTVSPAATKCAAGII